MISPFNRDSRSYDGTHSSLDHFPMGSICVFCIALFSFWYLIHSCEPSLWIGTTRKIAKMRAHQALRLIYRYQVANFGPNGSSRSSDSQAFQPHRQTGGNQSCSRRLRYCNCNCFDCVAAFFCLEGYTAIPIGCVLP